MHNCAKKILVEPWTIFLFDIGRYKNMDIQEWLKRVEAQLQETKEELLHERRRANEETRRANEETRRAEAQTHEVETLRHTVQDQTRILEEKKKDDYHDGIFNMHLFEERFEQYVNESLPLAEQIVNKACSGDEIESRINVEEFFNMNLRASLPVGQRLVFFRKKSGIGKVLEFISTREEKGLGFDLCW
jgi:hypothetical protein